MIIKYSAIICVLLVLLAAIVAKLFGSEIATFISCIWTINDVAAPQLQRFFGVLGLTMIGLTVFGVIKFIADAVGSP